MSKLRIGIIGAGGRGIASFGLCLAGNYADTTEIVALADPNRLRAEAGMEATGITADIHESAGDLVARKDIDAVIVTSPDYLHAEHAVAVLKHNKHVFVDKPLATTVEDCMRIIEAWRASKKLLYMGFNLRHDVVVRSLKQMAEQGVLGDVFSIQAIEYYNGGRSYHSRWNRLKKYSGGLWVHKGSHDFDVINHIMGAVRPVRVSSFASVFSFKPDRLPFKLRSGVEPGPNCTECPYQKECPDVYLIAESSPQFKMFSKSTSKLDGYCKNLCMYLSDKDTHDQGIAIIEYENGATAAHSEYFATPISNRRYFVEGTAGHAEGDVDKREVRFFPRWTKDVAIRRLAQQQGGHGGTDPTMVQDFIDCIRKSRHPVATAVDGTWSVAVGCAAELSREKKQVVEIANIMDTESQLLR